MLRESRDRQMCVENQRSVDSTRLECNGMMLPLPIHSWVLLADISVVIASLIRFLLYSNLFRQPQATPTIVPTASAMILKELKEPPRDRKKVKNIKHSGNITFDAVISIARILRSKSMAKKLRGTVKEVLGTAFSVGCTVNGQSPKALQEQIDSGDLTVPDE